MYQTVHSWIKRNVGNIMIVAGIMEEIGGIPLDELGIGEALQVDGALNITEGEAIDSADLNLSDQGTFMLQNV